MTKDEAIPYAGADEIKASSLLFLSACITTVRLMGALTASRKKKKERKQTKTHKYGLERTTAIQKKKKEENEAVFV